MNCNFLATPVKISIMRCSSCQHTNSRVLESRSAESGQSIRRRRECLNCQHRFTTYERIEFVPITVIKRDGKRESFDRSKLVRGLVRACEKTGLSSGQLETLAEEIEAQLQARSLREVASSDIGELVLLNLGPLSEVAYVRFASVYRQFRGIRDFVDTLNHLQSPLNEAVYPPTPPESTPQLSPQDECDGETKASSSRRHEILHHCE